jgi:plasmid replication initiation protein
MGKRARGGDLVRAWVVALSVVTKDVGIGSSQWIKKRTYNGRETVTAGTAIQELARFMDIVHFLYLSIMFEAASVKIRARR